MDAQTEVIATQKKHQTQELDEKGRRATTWDSSTRAHGAQEIESSIDAVCITGRAA